MSDLELSAVSGEKSMGEKSEVGLKVRRRFSQLLMLALLGQWSFYGIFRCPFIVPYVSCQNCPVITCHGRIFSLFYGFWLLVPLATLLVGRVFCGWACPGGLVSQLLGSLAPLKGRTGKGVYRWLTYGKYLGLAVALWWYFVFGQPRADVPIRVGEFFQSVSLTFSHAENVWLVRTIFVLACLTLGLAFANFWCRFACPAGGVLELLKPVSIFRYYKTQRCNDCDQCRAVCEMGTRPDEQNCTQCGDCHGVCERGAITFGRKKRQ